MRGFLIPAFQAATTIAAIVRKLEQELAARGLEAPIIVVDDGSTDETASEAEQAGATVVRHTENRGKGAALRTGLQWGREQGLDALVSLDADGQHPEREAVRLLLHQTADDQNTLVLGVRDLGAAGAPRKNRRSNRFSNWVLSLFGGTRLEDTQCGLRRYPIHRTQELASSAPGFAFESDTVLRAARIGMPLEHVPVEVIYPPESERVTHFDSVRDPARIVARVVLTTLAIPHHRWPRRYGRRLFYGLILLALLTLGCHHAALIASRIAPPPISLPDDWSQKAQSREDRETPVRRAGPSVALRRQGIWEVFLTGTAAEIGWAHGTLLRDRMIENERALLSAFRRRVGNPLLRTAILDFAAFRYRKLNRELSPSRQREIAARSLAFQPDPFESLFPTYQRFVYLSTLYDISLSFEHSPLIGCTTFTVSAPHSSTRGPLLARAFDFEVSEVFDKQKAVFFVREEGKIPFASVAWPGLVGIVSGINNEGLAAVVHGARGGPVGRQGEPVVHAVRRVLSEASTTEEAIASFNEGSNLVSHMVVVSDAHGSAAVLERSVGAPATVRVLPERAVVTNHLEGPLAQDPKNQRVLASTSTLHRRARGEAILRQAPETVGPETLLNWLRDRKAVDGTPLPPGDRRAIDALIATHGVIMDTKNRTLWVSRAPRLSGAFVRYDLASLFSAPIPDVSPRKRRATLPADPRRDAF